MVTVLIHIVDAFSSKIVYIGDNKYIPYSFGLYT